MRVNDSETRWELVPYFHGRVLELSEGRVKAFPHFIWGADLKIMEPHQLGIFAGQSLDAIVSSYMLHLMTEDRIRPALAEWFRVVKQDGHIVLHLPKENARWEVSRESICQWMAETGRGWDLVHFADRGDNYISVFRLIQGRKQLFSCDNPKPAKTCGIVRLGAFGDCIQASSILPWLKEQGYHITFYCSDHGVPVIQHDPHIDRFIIQGKDEVPPALLGDFYAHEAKKYDKWVDLCESVEGTILPPSERSNFSWPDAVRAKYMDMNYIEFTHELAEVPPPYNPRFYSTVEEKAWARKEKTKIGGRVILWSLSGSSVHKTWPHLDAIIARLMLCYPDVQVVTVGDELSQMLEAGWEAESRVHRRCGKWSIRQSMSFAEVADLIIGTETGLLNAAGSMDTPKIVTLSHSSENMLTKHWKNVTPLRQTGAGCPKQPCRQLHHTFEHCMEHMDTGTAMCQFSIGIEQMWDAVVKVLGIPQRKVAYDDFSN